MFVFFPSLLWILYFAVKPWVKLRTKLFWYTLCHDGEYFHKTLKITLYTSSETPLVRILSRILKEPYRILWQGPWRSCTGSLRILATNLTGSCRVSWSLRILANPKGSCPIRPCQDPGKSAILSGSSRILIGSCPYRILQGFSPGFMLSYFIR